MIFPFLRSSVYVACFLVLVSPATIQTPVVAQAPIAQGIMTAREFLNLSAASRRVYAAGFVDALLLTPILKNSLAGMGVPIRCFEGMNDEQIAAIISKEIASRPENWHLGANVQALNSLVKVCPEFVPPK